MDFRLLGKEECKMNVEKSLEKAGVDTKKYPSLAMQNILGYQGKALAENSYRIKRLWKMGMCLILIYTEDGSHISL